jgi:hypothetical protein
VGWFLFFIDCPRGWPEEIAMSPEIIELVNRRWGDYDIT